MYENDYIRRMIDEMAAIVAKIFFYRRAANYQAALIEIDNAYETLLRIDPNTARDLPLEEVADLVRRMNIDNPDFGVALGVLLREEAETIASRDGFTALVLTLYEKSLISFVTTVTEQEVPNTDECRKSIEAIVSRIDGYPYSDTAAVSICRYHEWKGAYGKAEDLLYLLESKGRPDAEAQILQFYQRLLGKSDSELRDGNLPRQEIVQALRERRARYDQR